jgi:2-oxoglutarate dehydrogenase E1 component
MFRSVGPAGVTAPAGSMHFIINNQIGFTTNPPSRARAPYPSDVAKMIEAPIFHVNGDDPEAVVYAAKVATEFRQKFGKPVVIDMFCYRRFGHNEGDEPAFTQPIMYKPIRQAPDGGGRALCQAADRRRRDHRSRLEAMKADFRKRIWKASSTSASYKPNKADWLDGLVGLLTAKDDEPRRGKTGVNVDRLARRLGKKLTDVPDDFKAHRTIKRVHGQPGQGDDRERRGHRLGHSEALAFGSLVEEGSRSACRARMSSAARSRSAIRCGSTRNRGALHSARTMSGEDQARFEVINSMLSEEAVLGFEYGYSLAEPKR